LAIYLESFLGFWPHPLWLFVYVNATGSLEFERFMDNLRIMPGVCGPTEGRLLRREKMLTTPERELFFAIQLDGDTAGWRRVLKAWAQFKEAKFAEIEGSDLVIDGVTRVPLGKCTCESAQLNVAEQTRLAAERRRKAKERARRRHEGAMAASKHPAGKGALENPLREPFSLSTVQKYGDAVDLAHASFSNSHAFLPVVIYFIEDDETAHDDEEQDRLYAALESDFNRVRKLLNAEFGPSWLGKRDSHSGSWDTKSKRIPIVPDRVAWWKVGNRELFLATSKEDRETPFFLVVGALPVVARP
jgi:hypothetical protein